MNLAKLRAGFAVPVMFALFAFTIFVALGTWQMQRRTWKTALIRTMEQRFAGAPVRLPLPASWAKIERSQHEFERVIFSGTFERGTHARIYGIGSAVRTGISGPGFWIFAPIAVTSGGIVVINRGFVPEGAQDDEPPTGTIELIGVLRWPDPRSFFSPADDPQHDLWFARDQFAIAATKGWGDVAPFYVDLEAPLPPGGLPAPAPLRVNLRNDHLQYAITWYGLAAVVLVMFSFWVKSHGRRVS